MSKAKLLVAVFVAALSVSALASASASAELPPAEWMLNGKTLLEEGLTTAALKPVAAVDENATFTGAGLTITCTGVLEGKKSEITMPTKISAESLIFTTCAVTGSTASVCSVPSTIGTVPVVAEPTLDGPLAVKAVVKPSGGTVFTTIAVKSKVTKGECVAEGNKPVTGDVEVLVPRGQDEETDQLLQVNQTATGLLKFGSGSATLKGSALLLLANEAAWSFL